MKGIIKIDRLYFKVLLIILLFTIVSACNGVTPSSPIISSFSADPVTIDEGDSVTLNWITNATTVSINQGVGTVTAPSGSVSVSPTETTTYTLTATNAAGSITANVTVTVSSVLKKVIDAVKEDILPDIPEVQSGDYYRCLLLEVLPLPPGTFIEEDSDLPMKANANITLQDERYFFYLDLAPGSFYAHPVKYILVDEEGNHEEYDAQWWPKINNKIPDIFAKDIPDEEDVIASNITFKKPIGTIPDYIFEPIYLQPREGFIVVQGLMPDENLYGCSVDTYLNAINFFNAYKNSSSRVEGLVQSQATQVLDTIDTMAEEDRSIITVFIIAHGNVNTVRLGGQRFYASEFRNKMAEYPAIIFNFILGSCHSGSFIDDLSTLSNVCAVETACASDEGAWPDYDEYGSADDINPSDVGSEWTSSLIEAMFEIAQDSDKIKTIQTWASNNDVPVTSMLICQGGFGAVGVQPSLGLTDNLDLTSIIGWSTPSHYCSYEYPLY